MARLTGNIKIQVYTDSQSTNNPQSRIVDINENLTDEAVTEFQPLLVRLNAGSSPQIIEFNGVDNPSKLFLFSDNPINLSLNGGPDIEVTQLCWIGGEFTTISISNPSTINAANVRFGIGN